MPANISIVGLTNVLNFLEENSDRNSAPDTPKGIAISKEPPAIRAVPASRGKVPNFGKRPLDTIPITDAGSLRSQGYCDFTYFQEDYVGASRTF